MKVTKVDAGWYEVTRDGVMYTIKNVYSPNSHSTSSKMFSWRLYVGEYGKSGPVFSGSSRKMILDHLEDK